jgi:methionine aminopeptidase
VCGELTFFFFAVALAELPEAPQKKGTCFPTCISLNGVIGHYAPFEGEEEIALGDVVKVELGVHVQGYVASTGTTVVAGTNVYASPETLLTHPLADRLTRAMAAGTYAMQAIARSLRPGTSNHLIRDMATTLLAAFDVNAVDRCISFSAAQYVADGPKHLALKPPVATDPETDIEEAFVAVNDVYVVDVRVSTGTGHLKIMQERPTVFRRNLEEAYMLRTKLARQALSEVDRRFPTFPFAAGQLTGGAQVRFGLKQAEQASLVEPYIMAREQSADDVVILYKATMLVTGNETIVSTFVPTFPEGFGADAIVDPGLQSVLALGLVHNGQPLQFTPPHSMDM